jgi:hypothetical protein
MSCHQGQNVQNWKNNGLVKVKDHPEKNQRLSLHLKSNSLMRLVNIFKKVLLLAQNISYFSFFLGFKGFTKQNSIRFDMTEKGQN